MGNVVLYVQGVAKVEPVTEQRDVPAPVVYGFLRLVGATAARHRALSEALSEYCRSHELHLGGVFSEHDGGLADAAFTGLLDALEVPGTYGVVLPSLSHLGPRAIAAERQHRITVLGGRLVLLRRPGSRAAHRGLPRPSRAGSPAGPRAAHRSRRGFAPDLHT